MRTLPILLCSLLVLAPAQGQRAVQPTAPNFYVPYGVRDVPIVPLEEYSSSSSQDGQPYEIALVSPEAPIPQRCPMRSRQRRSYRAPYGMYPPPSGFTGTGVLVTLGILSAVLFAAGIAGMQ